MLSTWFDDAKEEADVGPETEELVAEDEEEEEEEEVEEEVLTQPS